MWTRRPCIIGGQTAPDDFTIYRHKQAVGRVCRAVALPGTRPFHWMTWTHPCANGRAETFDQALHELREAIRHRWPDEIEAGPLQGTVHRNLP